MTATPARFANVDVHIRIRWWVHPLAWVLMIAHRLGVVGDMRALRLTARLLTAGCRWALAEPAGRPLQWQRFDFTDDGDTGD